MREAALRQYTVILTPDLEVGGYTVRVPALPGCNTQGETLVEALLNAQEAIEVVESVDKDGKAIPTGIKWGAAFRFEFDFSVDDTDKVKVSFGSIRVYGSTDEEYYNFSPKITPQVEVTDAKKEMVNKGAFCPT